MVDRRIVIVTELVGSGLTHWMTTVSNPLRSLKFGQNVFEASIRLVPANHSEPSLKFSDWPRS